MKKKSTLGSFTLQMMPKQITSLLHVLCLVVWWKWFLFSWKGLRPCESNETKCTFPMGRCLDQTCWSASYKVHQPKCISISVFPPSNVCIGRYILNMQITSCGHTYQRCLGDFYVLFNPWCAGKNSSSNQIVLWKIVMSKTVEDIYYCKGCSRINNENQGEI